MSFDISSTITHLHDGYSGISFHLLSILAYQFCMSVRLGLCLLYEYGISHKVKTIIGSDVILRCIGLLHSMAGSGLVIAIAYKSLGLQLLVVAYRIVAGIVAIL